jgi:hypothetical protein
MNSKPANGRNCWRLRPHCRCHPFLYSQGPQSTAKAGRKRFTSGRMTLWLDPSNSRKCFTSFVQRTCARPAARLLPHLRLAEHPPERLVNRQLAAIKLRQLVWASHLSLCWQQKCNRPYRRGIQQPQKYAEGDSSTPCIRLRPAVYQTAAYWIAGDRVATSWRIVKLQHDRKGVGSACPECACCSQMNNDYA